MGGAAAILTVNAGSSTLKFALFDDTGQRVAGGSVEGRGTAEPAVLCWTVPPASS